LDTAVAANDVTKKLFIDLYLLQGRLHQKLSNDDLSLLWTATFKALFQSRSVEDMQAHYDVRAEFEIRGVEPPVETVESELKALKAAPFATTPGRDSQRRP
jgi:hypothetical protein